MLVNLVIVYIYNLLNTYQVVTTNDHALGTPYGQRLNIASILLPFGVNRTVNKHTLRSVVVGVRTRHDQHGGLLVRAYRSQVHVCTTTVTSPRTSIQLSHPWVHGRPERRALPGTDRHDEPGLASWPVRSHHSSTTTADDGVLVCGRWLPTPALQSNFPAHHSHFARKKKGLVTFRRSSIIAH